MTIENRISELVKKGFKKDQAYIIAKTMHSKNKAQQGTYIPPFENSLDGNPMQNYSNPLQNYPQPTVPYQGAFGQSGIPYFDPNQPTEQDLALYNKEQANPTLQPITIDGDPAQEDNTTHADNKRLNVYNPFGGVSLENSLYTLGQGLGEKDAYKTGIGAGLSALKIGRTGLAGFSAGKENKRVYDEYYKNLYADNRRPTMLQEGGDIKVAEALTGKFLTDQGQGNIELESGEHVKNNQTGNIQEVIGKTHKEGGVQAKLSDAKILSDYTKIGAKNAKELKEKYKLSVKATHTFADVMDKMNKKLGVDKAIEEQTKAIEDLGKNESVKDATTKRLNETVLTKEVQEYENKLEELKGAQNFVFEDIFNRQEAKGKIGDGKTLLDEKGKPMAQEGGEYLEIAKKHGVSEQRAHELMMAQEGGIQSAQEDSAEGQASNAQEDQAEVTPEQIIQAFCQMTGQDTKVVIQQLQQMSEQEQQQAISQMYATLQQGQQNPQEEQTEGQMSNPQEEGQEIAQEGGYSFSTRVTPTLKGFDTNGTSILNQDTLSNVEEMQPYTGKGYGAKMADVQKTIDIHKWYFDTEEKKKAFIEAVLKEGDQPEVKAFQKAYNKELEDRATKAGVPKDEVKSIVDQVGFSDSGVKKLDGLFGAFTSTRPLYNFTKKDGQVEVTPTTETTPEQQQIVARNNVKTVMPNLPVDFILPPSALQPIVKPYVPLGRIEPIKQTVEPYLAEQERQRVTAQEQVSATGLPPQIQQALQAQQLATTQMSANDAIGKVENFNAQNQFQADQFNIGQGDKEQILNAQFNQDYQNKMMQSTANQERDLRRYFNQNNAINRQNFNDVSNLNLTNAMFEQFQSDGSNIYFMNNKPAEIKSNMDLPANWDTLTPQQQDAYKKAFTAKIAMKKSQTS